METIPIPQKQKKTASLKNDLLVVSLCLKQPYLGVVVGAKTTCRSSTLKEQGLIGSIAVVDTSDEARLSAKSADFTSPTMEGIDADFVVIATPSQLHSSQALELLENNFHVLVEKPLGCSESEARPRSDRMCSREWQNPRGRSPFALPPRCKTCKSYAE